MTWHCTIAKRHFNYRQDLPRLVHPLALYWQYFYTDTGSNKSMAFSHFTKARQAGDLPVQKGLQPYAMACIMFGGALCTFPVHHGEVSEDAHIAR